MWFGSCEGVNFFDGLNFQLYNPIDKKKILSGNIVESILEAENNILWIQTNYGLDRLEKYSQTVHSFRQFKGKNWVVNSTDNRIFVVNSDNYIYYYVPEEQQFRGIQVDNLIADIINGDEVIPDPESFIPIIHSMFYSFRFKWNDSYFFFCPG